MSDEPQPPEKPPSDEPRDFRQVVAIYAIAPVLTHVAATVAVLSMGVDLGPLGTGLLVASTITIVVLLLVGLLAFRR